MLNRMFNFDWKFVLSTAFFANVFPLIHFVRVYLRNELKISTLCDLEILPVSGLTFPSTLVSEITRF